VTAARAMREQLRDVVPWWLSDRHFTSGATVGFRFLWAAVAPLDAFFEYALESLRASWPDQAPEGALGLIGRSRGILRGQIDTADEYRARLRAWLDKWADAGSQRQLAIELHEYLADHPRVRIVNRAGLMVTVDEDGTVSTAQVAWDWDSVSHPERAGYWSELWIVIHPTQWAFEEGTWGDGSAWGDAPELGMGHDVPREAVDAVKGLVAQWKAAHSRVRAVIWCTDGTRFDPTDEASLPNGNWGSWGVLDAGTFVPSDRELTTCRYWEL
jgi:hypothetical protein